MIYLLPQAVDQMAARHPDREAVRFGRRSLSYGQLAAQSNSLARTLVELGVKRRDRVGIYQGKSLEMAVAIYGIMKAGAAYVPIDPASPPSRLEYVVRHCGIGVVVSQGSRLAQLQQIAAAGAPLRCVVGVSADEPGPVECLGWDQALAAPGGAPPDVGLIEQDLAYIMYTSGSTGEPKGIMHTHHSGLSYARWAASAYGLHGEDRLTNHAPLHFDLSTFDFFSGALAGAATVIVAEEVLRFPASYAQLLDEERISVCFTVPFAMIQLLLRGALDKRNLSSLRWFIFGGEPFPTKHLRDLMNCLPSTGFSNMYGPAETNGCTYYNVPALGADANEPVPIGRACPNVELLIVDADDQPVPAGEAGELLVRSPTMMQGYWQRPDLNSKAFYRRPVFENYSDYFYRTGDLVRRAGDGELHFIGRKDRQIKVRGYRVELDEVEVGLLAHEAVEEAAAFPIANADGARQVGAAVRLRRGAECSEAELNAYLKARLPWYAVPATIALAEDFPRTSSGKIDRRALEAAAAGAEQEL